MRFRRRAALTMCAASFALMVLPATAAAQQHQNSVSDEIIVTAQRRAEFARDVPMSITAIDAETLQSAGVTSTLDIARLAPGVEMPMYGGFLQPSIRGVSSAGAGLGDSSNVALYVDGVYQPSQSGQLMDLPDVQRIEVLKGPQGTLYGQNAAGGAIIISTVTPSDEFSGRVSASYGNFDDRQLRGYVTGPVAEGVAFSLSGSYREREGLRRDVLRGGRGVGLDSQSVRGQLRLEPTTDLTITLAADYGRRTDGDTYAGQPYSGPGAGPSAGEALANGYSLPVRFAGGPDEFSLNVVPSSRITRYGVSARAELDTDIGTFNSVTAYGDVEVRNIADIDYTPVNLGDVDLRIDQHNFLQELNYVSEQFGPATITAGVFYLHSVESYVPQIANLYYFGVGVPTAYPTNPTPLLVSGYFGESTKNAYAAYAELGWDFTDRLHLNIGGRYSHEEQETASSSYPSTNLQSNPNNPFTFERFTPRATLLYRLTPEINVYASYSEGFKSGYKNPSPSTVGGEPVRPEIVTAYEIGLKGRIENLNLELALFRYDYQNLQVFYYTPPEGIYQNAASAEINGVDFRAEYNFTPDFSVSLAGTLLDASYGSFKEAGVYLPNGGGNTPVNLDATGNRLIRAPEFTGNIGVRYGFETGSGRVDLFGFARYNSGVTYSADERIRQPSYSTYDAEVAFSPARWEGMRISLYGRNLSDDAYLSSVLSSQFVDGVSYAEPRTFGVRLDYDF